MQSPMTLHLIVEGRVQGVGYRAWGDRTARALNLSGWIRNRCNGSVEIAVQGDQRAVDEFLKLAKSGPRLAHVENVRVVENTATETFGAFQIRPTE